MITAMLCMIIMQREREREKKSLDGPMFLQVSVIKMGQTVFLGKGLYKPMLLAH